MPKIGWRQEITINDTTAKMKNENYRKFSEQKKLIQSKYDSRLFVNERGPGRGEEKIWFKEHGREEWRKYLKELMDVIEGVDSYYTKFMEDIEPIYIKGKRNDKWGL